MTWAQVQLCQPIAWLDYQSHILITYSTVLERQLLQVSALWNGSKGPTCEQIAWNQFNIQQAKSTRFTNIFNIFVHDHDSKAWLRRLHTKHLKQLLPLFEFVGNLGWELAFLEKWANFFATKHVFLPALCEAICRLFLEFCSLGLHSCPWIATIENNHSSTR